MTPGTEPMIAAVGGASGGAALLRPRTMAYALLVPGLVLAALLVAPPFLSGFLLTLLTQALIYAILAIAFYFV